MNGSGGGYGCVTGNSGDMSVPKSVTSSSLGTFKREAILTALSRKGPWHCARTLATQAGMTNKWLVGTRVDICQRTVGENSLPGYGPVILMNRPVRTRMRGGVGAGGEKPPATRLCTPDMGVTHGVKVPCKCSM